MIRGESADALSDETSIPLETLEEWHERVLAHSLQALEEPKKSAVVSVRKTARRTASARKLSTVTVRTTPRTTTGYKAIRKKGPAKKSIPKRIVRKTVRKTTGKRK
jgi:hypothetical protein